MRIPLCCRVLVLSAITALLVSCRSSHESPVVVAVDLVSTLGAAECRPAGACSVTVNPRAAIRVPAPARITWTLAVPHEAHLLATASATGAAAVRFRVGISDDRTYDALTEVVVSPAGGPKALDVDLSAYAGWKWSLFYHPDRIRWHVVFSTDAIHGTPGTAEWIVPRIVTTNTGAREYRRRTTRSGGP